MALYNHCRQSFYPVPTFVNLEYNYSMNCFITCYASPRSKVLRNLYPYIFINAYFDNVFRPEILPNYLYLLLYKELFINN